MKTADDIVRRLKPATHFLRVAYVFGFRAIGNKALSLRESQIGSTSNKIPPTNIVAEEIGPPPRHVAGESEYKCQTEAANIAVAMPGANSPV
jgi:hypothetical protein